MISRIARVALFATLAILLSAFLANRGNSPAAKTPPVSLTPTTFSFGSVDLYKTSPAKGFKVQNNQPTSLSFSSISVLGGDFSEPSTTCSSTLAAGATCTVYVVFSPTAAGLRTGQLAIKDNASNSPQTADLSGTGVPVLQSITVAPSTATIAVGQKQQFMATGYYNDGSTKDLTATATWTSSKNSVAKIGSTGLATGVAIGQTTITAAISGGHSATASLTVTNRTLTAITVTPAESSVPLGTTQQYKATGTYSDGSTLDITNNNSVTWASGTPAVATISAAGLASSVSVGTTGISATSGTISGSATLTVTGARLVSIVVTPVTPTIPNGTQQQFTATGIYTDNRMLDLTRNATWSTSPMGIATVIEGLATGNAIGTTTVAATVGTVTGTASLTVSPPVLSSIVVTPSNPSVAVGISEQFKATGVFSDGSNSDLTSQVTWASANSATASITTGGAGAGLATSLATGSVQITATLNSVVGSTT